MRLPNRSLKTLQAAVAAAGLVHGHSSYSNMMLDYNMSTSATMITTFREPSARLTSHFRYHWGKGQAYAAELMRTGGRDAVLHAYSQFVEVRGPMQGRSIAFQHAPEEVWTGSGCGQAKTAHSSNLYESTRCERRVSPDTLAKIEAFIAQRFAVVGVLERPAETLEVLRCRLGIVAAAQDAGAIVAEMPHSASTAQRGKYPVELPRDTAAVRDSTSLEWHLYRHANAVLSADVACCRRLAASRPPMGQKHSSPPPPPAHSREWLAPEAAPASWPFWFEHSPTQRVGIGKTMFSYFNSAAAAALLGRDLATRAYDDAVAFDGGGSGSTSSILRRVVVNQSSSTIHVPSSARSWFAAVGRKDLCVGCADGLCFFTCLWPFPTEINSSPSTCASSQRMWRPAQQGASVPCPFRCNPRHPLSPWYAMLGTEATGRPSPVADVEPGRTDGAAAIVPVIHFRCVIVEGDKAINTLTWDQLPFGTRLMGLLRHRYYLDRIPKGATAIRLVGVDSSGTAADRLNPNCASALNLLKASLQKLAPVQMVKHSLDDDWSTLATAKVLICGLSEFCLTAAMVGPKRVYFPYVAYPGSEQGNDSPTGDPPSWQPSSQNIIQEHRRKSDFHWVSHAPGEVMNCYNVSKLPWGTVRAFLES